VKNGNFGSVQLVGKPEIGRIWNEKSGSAKFPLTPLFGP
jgi:hypothetical protein